MLELLDWLDYIEDIRQTSKVRHKLKDILVIVLFATLAGTECRVMSMIPPDVLQQLYGKWQELLNREEGEILKRSFVLMEKQCIPMEQNINEPIMWYRRGVKKMDIV